MIVLRKNEAQARKIIAEAIESREIVKDAANACKEALAAFIPAEVNYKRIVELLEMRNEAELILELFDQWKKKKGVNLPLSLIRTNDESAWPEEIKKAYYAILSLRDMSKDLSRYWDAKSKSFKSVELTKDEEKAVYAHCVEYVTSERKKRQYEHLEQEAELINEYNAMPPIRNNTLSQITPVKLRELLPHYASFLDYKQEGQNAKLGEKGYFIYEVNKAKFIKREPRPALFI